jgi:hypothetical protein
MDRKPGKVSNWVEPAPTKQPGWEIRHDDELWFTGRMILQSNFRPDIKRVDRERMLAAIARCLNMQGVVP